MRVVPELRERVPEKIRSKCIEKDQRPVGGRFRSVGVKRLVEESFEFFPHMSGGKITPPPGNPLPFFTVPKAKAFERVNQTSDGVHDCIEDAFVLHSS